MTNDRDTDEDQEQEIEPEEPILRMSKISIILVHLRDGVWRSNNFWSGSDKKLKI